jgi:hypothetical protein
MPRDLLIHNEATGLAEAGPLNIVQDATSARPGRMKIELITPGWGSSGYYSAATLEAAAKAGVFPAGLQMYADHPTESEKYERPERSIRDLGAVLVTPGTWDGKAIVAEAQVFSAFAGALAEMREHIGVSIRAQGEFEFGEAEGRQGRIITALTEATSVDFVTRAGRGGRIIDVLESIRPSKVTARAIEHGISEATANDTREALQSALVERFGGDKVWLWVRDFDDTWSGTCTRPRTSRRTTPSSTPSPTTRSSPSPTATQSRSPCGPPTSRSARPAAAPQPRNPRRIPCQRSRSTRPSTGG